RGAGQQVDGVCAEDVARHGCARVLRQVEYHVEPQPCEHAVTVQRHGLHGSDLDTLHVHAVTALEAGAVVQVDDQVHPLPEHRVAEQEVHAPDEEHESDGGECAEPDDITLALVHEYSSGHFRLES